MNLHNMYKEKRKHALQKSATIKFDFLVIPKKISHAFKIISQQKIKHAIKNNQFK